ncbi:rhodanese-like domain-containing protein [Geobacter sp. FeAm09]|uniref:rhodanese-like domain-containing protein n=1 Tax=Geobacter sp. FeAm09 TaxID=2597769 RepID=UPI0011EC55AC|nr:rhodanese-like domain-containing protein [Geobacter sp. FeAm09]QEM66905.1 rhodanese-like domain-containing protein [Geobacter sp. FeAm09]
MMKDIRLFCSMAALFLAMATAALGAEQPVAGAKTISTEQLKLLLETAKPKPLLIDARNPEEYEEVHIKDAVNIPIAKLEKDPSLLPADRARKLVFYCNGVKCGKSKKAATLAVAHGYGDVFIYAEGMPVWEEKGMPIFAGASYEKRVETSKLSPRELKALMDAKPGSLVIVDVRDKNEYAAGHIPGAINIPVTAFAAGSGVLEKEKRIVVYCNSGGRSYNAYRKLQKLAYPTISQAIFADWEFEGLPVEK